MSPNRHNNGYDKNILIVKKLTEVSGIKLLILVPEIFEIIIK